VNFRQERRVCRGSEAAQRPETIADQGIDRIGSSPTEFIVFMDKGDAKYAEAIKASKIKPEYALGLSP
jgi:hypothetical protein